MAIAVILAGELIQTVAGYLQARAMSTSPSMAVTGMLGGWALLGFAAGGRGARLLPTAIVKLALTFLMVAASLIGGGTPAAGFVTQAWISPLLPLTRNALPVLPRLAGSHLPALIALTGVLTTLAWLAGVRAGRPAGGT